MKLLKKYVSLIFFIGLFTHSATSHSQEPVRPGQTYIIEAYQGVFALDVEGASNTNGSKVILFYRHNGNNQLFRFEPTGDGYYYIRAHHSNKVLDIRGASSASDGILQQWDHAGVLNQQFRLNLAAGSGHYYIIARHSNMALQTTPSNTPGSDITQVPNAGVTNQMFKFIPQNPPASPPPTSVSTVKLEKPTLIVPISGQIVTNRNGEVWKFDWSDVSNATSYQILIEHKNKKDRLLNTYITTSSYDFQLLNAVADHLTKDGWVWWVRARNGTTFGPWSNSHWLYLAGNSSVFPPQLISPTHHGSLPNGNAVNASTYAWSFDWSDVAGATTYQIVITSPGGQEGSVNTNVAASNYKYRRTNAVRDAYRNDWSWQVRAYVNGAWSIWTKSNLFNVGPASTTPPPPVESPFIAQSKNDFTVSSAGKNYVSISNKTDKRVGKMSYNLNAKKLSMKGSSGRWKLQRVNNSRYNILVEIGNKFWALGLDDYNSINLVSPVDPKGQLIWEIQQQSDGYYRISNVGLKAKNNQEADLFIDSGDDVLFLSSWKEGKTLNGRWHFGPGSSITANSDPFDNKEIYLRSAFTNELMCLGYWMTSDATGYNFLGPCKAGESDPMKFEKALDGNYFIRVYSSNGSERKWYYLGQGYRLEELERHDVLNPGYGMTYRIINKGNGNHMIVNHSSEKAFQLTSGNGFPDQITLENPSNRSEQYWRFQ